MRFRHHGAALLAAAALSCALPAHADNYVVRDGNNATQTFGAKLLGGVLYPIHLLYGLFGSTPTPVAVDSSGNVGVNCISGCSGGGGSLSATAHATAPSDLTEGQTSAGLVVDLSHHLFVRSMQDGAWNVGITGSLPGFASTPTFNVGTMPNVTIAGFAATPAFKVVDSGGADATDTANHAIKVNVVAGGVGGGAMTVADGADVTLGAKADASCGTDTGTCTLQALIKRLNASITTLNGKIDTLNTTASGSIASGANIIGKVGIDQTAPGTTNGVRADSSGATGSAVPARASYTGAVSSGNLTGLIQSDASAPINVSTATTTQLVALTSGQKIYVTSFDVVAGGTGNITFEYGTGTNCGTGTTILTGAYNLTAQAGIAKGSGLGPVLVVPAGNALCVLTSAAVQMSGSVAYTKF